MSKRSGVSSRAPHPSSSRTGRLTRLIMSKKKGLSNEEKCKKVLEIFTESQDVYNLKDIERIAPKSKGVISQSVKDVLNQLVADNLIESDKIGASTYFWSFASKNQNRLMSREKELQKAVNDLKAKQKELKKQIRAATVSEEEAAQRQKVVKKVAKLRAKKQELQQEIDKYQDCDPDGFEAMQKEAEVAGEAVERWTSNVMAIRSWVTKKTGMTESEVNKQFQIPPDFDYLDDD